MQELEKQGQKNEIVPKRPEPKLKKISSEANIKFESKKEKIPPKNENNSETALKEKKPEVRVSKSIEGQNPKKKVSKKDSNSGSTLSLQKIFIDGPKEFFRSSKEKLYKLSKETLYDINEPVEESKCTEQKPSRSEMQNYLLSHVLFDGREVMKKEKEKFVK